jgi:hypothetical protein
MGICMSRLEHSHPDDYKWILLNWRLASYPHSYAPDVTPSQMLLTTPNNTPHGWSLKLPRYGYDGYEADQSVASRTG